MTTKNKVNPKKEDYLEFRNFKKLRLKKKILILGPLWRNKNIINKLKDKYHILITNEKINTKFIKANSIKYIVASGYPYRVKQNIISKMTVAINLHISYLPYGRGMMPNLWCFYENYPPGITIHELDKNFDTGKILIQKKIFFKNIKKHTLISTHDFLLKKLEFFFLENVDKIVLKKLTSFKQDKYIKIERYHTKKESNKLIKKFKSKWHTKINEIVNCEEK